MKRLNVYWTLGLISMLFVASGSAQEFKKLAQSGMEFLNVKADARAMAMAGAATALEMGSGSLFFNPAGMANMNSTLDLVISRNQWIADIEHRSLSLAVQPFGKDYGTVGFTIQDVDYGELQWTMVDNTTDKGYTDLGFFSPSALGIGVGYAKALTDRFSVGGQIHWVRQRLGENILPKGEAGRDTVKNEVSPLSFDFGTLFKTGIKSLAFGMSVRNFSKEIRFYREGFQLPLTFTMGISMDVMDFIPNKGFDQSLIVSFDAVHHRSHPEQIMIGVDYTLLKKFSLRGGYISADDEDSFSFGVGLRVANIGVDYAYTPFGIFDSVQRFTARISM